MDKTQFRFFDTEGGKFRYYPTLERGVRDFSLKELKRQSISVLYNGTVVGEVNTEKIVDETR